MLTVYVDYTLFGLVYTLCIAPLNCLPVALFLEGGISKKVTVGKYIFTIIMILKNTNWCLVILPHICQIQIINLQFACDSVQQITVSCFIN